LECERTSIDGSNATFDCYGASACQATACPEYGLIASGVALPVSFFFPPGEVPVDSYNLDYLVGTWRFVVTKGQTTTEFRYRIDRVERSSEGAMAVGVALDTEDPAGWRPPPTWLYAAQVDDQFVLWDQSSSGCNTYLFRFVDSSRLDGTEFLTQFSAGLCTS